MSVEILSMGLPQQFAAKSWELFALILENSQVDGFDHVIDFGCGTGETTQRLAEWVGEYNRKIGRAGSKLFITGTDVSAVETSFCENVYSSSTDVSKAEFFFKAADIGDSTTMAPEWESAFDLVTSFWTNHSVKNQEEILKNIHFCLKPGGYFCLYDQTGFDAIPADYDKELKHYRMTKVGLGMLPKWSQYLPAGGLSELVFPGQAAYQSWGRPDPAAGYTTMVLEAGFRVISARNEFFRYDYSEEELATTVKHFSRRVEGLPSEYLEEFVGDFVYEYKRLFTREESDEWRKLKADMGVIVVVGRKL